MFERYTETARRVIFFARYEASQFGSPYIETEHLLLGLLREDKALANRFLRSDAAVESIRRQIEGHTTFREKWPTSVDLPLNHECKQVLVYGAEEAERLNDKHIGTEHLLLGLLREDKCFAAVMLGERGLRLSTVREELQRSQAMETKRVERGLFESQERAERAVPLTDETRERIVKLFLDGHGMNDIVYLLDYRHNSDAVNGVIRERLRQLLKKLEGAPGAEPGSSA